MFLICSYTNKFNSGTPYPSWTAKTPVFIGCVPSILTVKTQKKSARNSMTSVRGVFAGLPTLLPGAAEHRCKLKGTSLATRFPTIFDWIETPLHSWKTANTPCCHICRLWQSKLLSKISDLKHHASALAPNYPCTSHRHKGRAPTI